MTRWISVVSRVGLAASVALLALSLLRWGPVYAEPPVDVRAQPLAPVVLAFAVAAALTATRRARPRMTGLLPALGAGILCIAGLVALRPNAGIAARVRGPAGEQGTLSPGPIDLVADDLANLPRSHRESVTWAGDLRVPESGFYRFWGAGEGSLRVTLDAERVLGEAGPTLPSGSSPVFLRAGSHSFEVEHGWSGPPAHFRLGWVRPRGRSEVIPARYLGPALPAPVWIGTDLLAVATALLFGVLVFLLPWDVPRRLPLARPMTRGELWGAAVGLLLVVLLMSYPLVLHLATTGPVDRADGRLNAWILSWDAHALLTSPRHLFDAPIFHPLPDSLAFSENLLLPAIAAAPATLLGGAVLGYNVALLLCLVTSGLGTYLLVRRVSGDSVAAFVAAVFFAAGAHRWFRLAHLHAQATTFLPLSLWAFDRFFEKRSLKRALGVGAFLFLQGLSSVYLGVITATTLGVASICGILGGLKGRGLLRLLLGVGIPVLFLFPVVAPYLRMSAFEGREWSLEEVARSATTPESYAASATALWGPWSERHADEERTREPLFPGVVPLVLGCAGLAVAPRRYRLVGLLGSGVAILISLGPATPFYRFLYAHVFLFHGVRALNRFSLVPVLALCVFSGLALSGKRWGRVLALGLGLLEASNIPLGLGTLSPPGPSSLALRGGGGAVLYMPLGENDTTFMLEGSAHWRPLVNGDSGFVPIAYRREKELLEGGVSADAARFLRAIDVTAVVSQKDLALPLKARFEDASIFLVPEGERAHVVERGLPRPTLWNRSGPMLDLEEPSLVGRVSFEISDGPWKAHPFVLLSVDGVTWMRVQAEASLADATLSLTRDPQAGRGEVRFTPMRARFVCLDPGLPVSEGLLGFGP